jgi:hypothetical protein
MSAQPEALRLANALEKVAKAIDFTKLALQTAAELRRLHQANTDLLEALTRLSTAAMARENVMGDVCTLFAAQAAVRDANVRAQAAIAAAMKETP